MQIQEKAEAGKVGQHGAGSHLPAGFRDDSFPQKQTQSTETQAGVNDPLFPENR